MASIGPFVSDAWREFLSSGGGLAGPGGYTLPGIPYPPLEGTEEANGEDPKVAVAHYLARRGLDRAILDPGASGSLGGLANEVMGSELARATNDWLLAEWASVDDRLSASIVVTARDGGLAAKEIHRLGDDPRFAQVLFASPPCLLGDRSLLPIFAAAEQYGLPIVLRAEGAYSGRNRGVSAVGHPTSRYEYEVDLPGIAPAHVLSAICEGVFDRFPGLRLVMSGFGIAWLPALLWRADREYHAGRVKPPRAITRLPSEVVQEHVRFTTDSLEIPADAGRLTSLLSSIDGAALLVFASGMLPRGDSALPIDALPGDWRERALRENAHDLYPTLRAGIVGVRSDAEAGRRQPTG
jgi:uncharacterized protein